MAGVVSIRGRDRGYQRRVAGADEGEGLTGWSCSSWTGGATITALPAVPTYPPLPPVTEVRRRRSRRRGAVEHEDPDGVEHARTKIHDDATVAVLGRLTVGDDRN